MAVRTEGLTKRYAGAPGPAVDELDLSVAAGEVYGLLGPNGSGKSTTVGMLATLLTPTSGTATVAGHDVVREADAVRRRIGVTLQEAGTDPAATGRALLRTHARLLGFSGTAATQRADELLERVDLVDAADRAIRTYSGGMRRRLDLAAALVGEPAVLFLDEPTTGLDPISRRALWTEVERLRDAGTAILLTTQYLEEADVLADRVGIIAGGQLRAEGTPGELKRRLGGDVVTITVADGDAESAAGIVDGRAEAEDRVTVEVPDGAAAVPRLVSALAGQAITPRSIELAAPSLDDVFLDVAGRRLEVAA